MQYHNQNNSNGKAIASLVLGIVSIVFMFLFCWSLWFLTFFGIVLGIVAIVLGVFARKEGANGMATAGFILGIIGVCLNSLAFLICSCIAWAGLSMLSYL